MSVIRRSGEQVRIDPAGLAVVGWPVIADGRRILIRKIAGLLVALVLLASGGAATAAATTARTRSSLGRLSPSDGAHPPKFSYTTTEASLSKIIYMNHKAWTGESLFGPHNDWEPYVAADPSAPYVYVITTEFGNRACNRCPGPAFVYRVSSNDGASWGPPQHLCRCAGMAPGGSWQYDPTIAVANDGTVFVTVLSRWHTYVMRSTDHGQMWSTPVNVAPPGFGWTDHGQITLSPNGQDVYVAFNKADSYVVASHNGGLTWGTPVRTSPNSDQGTRYYYHYRGTVLPDGTVVIPATSVTAHPYNKHTVRYYALRSTDGGATWQQISLPSFQHAPDCVNPGCHHDHFAGMISIASDSTGRLVATYAGSRIANRGQVTFTSFSTDEGLMWSAPEAVSPVFAGTRRVISSFPVIAGTGTGDFRLWYMDNRKGLTSWNAWYTQSADGGVVWSKPVRISDAISGAGYVHPGGFDADYGDYGGIAIMSNGKTIATWGAAYSYNGPGGTWINMQP